MRTSLTEYLNVVKQKFESFVTSLIKKDAKSFIKNSDQLLHLFWQCWHICECTIWQASQYNFMNYHLNSSLWITVKHNTVTVNLMLNSVWNLADALTGFEFNFVYFQHFCKSLRLTALSTLIWDNYAELIEKKAHHFKSVFEDVYLWL